ncbi:MAG: ATP-binding protein [Myxococcota bacterium]
MMRGRNDRVMDLEEQLRAAHKTLDALIRRNLREQVDGTFQVLEQNTALQRVVARKTMELEEQRAKLADALEELKRTQSRLLHSQKMEAVGQLAAGVAHEINTPAQFVSDNVHYLRTAFADIIPVLDALTNVMCDARQGRVLPETLRRAEEALRVAGIESLLTEIPDALDQCVEGLSRISSIVRAMKGLSHSQGRKEHVNVHDVITSTVAITRNEWKYVADVELDLHHAMPLVPAAPVELNQVLLNLVVNAAHAVSDATDRGTNGKGLITIKTLVHSDVAEIRVQDTGTGIPESIRGRIFEPFFTTKAVGQGTGQGLAIAYAIVVKNHGGHITFETEVGRGTTFIVQLPLTAAPEAKTS